MINPQTLAQLAQDAPPLSRISAPTPKQFMPYLLVQMERAMGELKITSPYLSRTMSEQIVTVTQDVLRTLEERGEEYGEDLLFLTGEDGILTLTIWKAMRMLWSRHAGHDYTSRKDSWRDIIGYGILAMAMEQYIMDTGAAFSTESRLCPHGFVISCPDGCN